MTPQVAEKLYTLDEYLALPDDGKTYELVDGRLVEMAGPNIEHMLTVERLSVALLPHVWQNKLGHVLIEGAFSYDPERPNNFRRPDLAFVAEARMAGLNTAKAFLFAPDLAVEVVSPTDYAVDVEEKVAEYLHFGVRLVWVIYVRTQTVHIYRTTPPKFDVQDATGELSGGDVVPDFRLPVTALFERIAPPTV